MFNSFQKFCKIFSLTLLFAPAISLAAVAQGEDYYNFPTGDHEGGGVRGTLTSCATNVNYPVSLVPEASKTLTTSASPTLFFDVPDVILASTLEVVLRDRDDRIVYQNGFETGYQPGIIGLNISDESNSNALKINDLYHWSLIQECENSAEPHIVANGSLQRVELDGELVQRINNTSGIEKVKLYQEAELWHEAIANFVDMKCDSQGEIVSAWNDEEITDSLNLLNRSFQSYCLDNSELELAIQ